MSWPGRLAALLLLSAHLLLSYSHNFLVEPDDDRLWLYAVAIDLGRNQAPALNQRIHASLERLGRPLSQRIRFSLREQYKRNYTAAAGVQGIAARIAGGRVANLRVDYPAYLGRTMYASFVAVYGVTCLVVVLIAMLPGDRRWLLATLLAVTAIAAMETAFDLAGDHWSGLPTLLPDAQTRENFGQNLWPNLPALFINPQVQLSPFGDTPRNHFILLMLPLFLLRWRGWITASYLFLAGLAFVHQSHTGLVLAFLVAIDALMRPAIFRTKAALVVALVLVMFVGRESLGGVIGVARPIVLTAAAAGVLSIAVCIYWGIRGRTAGLARILGGIRDRLAMRGDPFADLAIIAVILAATFPIVAAINAIGSEAQSLYFWTQVHGRSLGIFRPALVLALALLAVSRLQTSSGERFTEGLVLMLAAAALVPSLFEASMHDRHPIARIEREARPLEAAVGPAIDWGAIGRLSEPEIYYAIARTLDTGR